MKIKGLKHGGNSLTHLRQSNKLLRKEKSVDLGMMSRDTNIMGNLLGKDKFKKYSKSATKSYLAKDKFFHPTQSYLVLNQIANRSANEFFYKQKVRDVRGTKSIENSKCILKSILGHPNSSLISKKSHSASISMFKGSRNLSQPIFNQEKNHQKNIPRNNPIAINTLGNENRVEIDIQNLQQEALIDIALTGKKPKKGKMNVFRSQFSNVFRVDRDCYLNIGQSSNDKNNG